MPLKFSINKDPFRHNVEHPDLISYWSNETTRPNINQNDGTYTGLGKIMIQSYGNRAFGKTQKYHFGLYTKDGINLTVGYTFGSDLEDGLIKVHKVETKTKNIYVD